MSTRSDPPLRERDPLTRLLRTRPLVLAAGLFLLGCALQCVLDPPAPAALAAMLALLILAALPFRRSALMPALLILALLPAGMLRFDLAWSAVSPLPERTGAQLTGRICEMPEFNPDTQRTICTLDEFAIDGISHGGKIRLYLRGDEAALRSVHLGSACG